jgi:alpha-L-arabinofuranosidase
MIYGNFRVGKLYYCDYTPLVTHGKDIGFGVMVMKSKIRFVAIIVFAFLCSALPIYAADVVSVNASSYIRAIPETMYGSNMQCWDGAQNGSNANVNALIAASGSRYVRWPGGSWGDGVLWSDMEGPNYSQTGRVSYGESMYRINKFDSIMQPIVNYSGIWSDSTGTDVNHWEAGAISAATAWVADQSSRTNCARYWEIGNEQGGPWEYGYFPQISGVYYGSRYTHFYNAMKAINPRIKIGADSEPCDTYQPWGWYVGKWTRDLLNTTDSNGIQPDFLIIHSYPGTDQPASYNPTLLSRDIQLIYDDTGSLNNIIATSIGPQYVGKIKYWMTEWDVGWGDYNKDIAYVSALFKAQYIMEMCKYGWEGSNPWSQNQYHSGDANYPSDYYVYPKWYFPALLNYYFGRDMVTASSTNSMVRAYASRDDANNLTIFMANNYPSTDRTVHINISGFGAASTGQRWLIQPAGSMISGGVNIQDYNDLMINGVVHPSPSTVPSLSGVSVTTGDSFDISLPRSSMLIIKIPPATPTTQLPYNGTAWPIPGTIEAENYDTGGKFVAYYDTTAGNSGGQYRSDDVDIETCSDGGFDVNGIYPGEWLEYSVDVSSSGLYKITAHVAAADSNGEFRIEFDGRDETGPVPFTPTGGAQVFGNTDVNAFLKKGLHTMRLLMDTNGWSIDKLTFTQLGNGTGLALREHWTGIAGGTVANLTSSVYYPWKPTNRVLEHSFEGPTNWGDTYGTRIRGYLHPVTTGTYYFYIASDDAGELWLSTDDNPANAVKICQVTNDVNDYQWDYAAEQKSSAKTLVAGQTYYIEARHKENGGSDNIAIGWEGPGILRQAITGAYLSPYVIGFVDFDNFASQWLKTGCKWYTGYCKGCDYDNDGNVQIDDLMWFVENWWLYGGE